MSDLDEKFLAWAAAQSDACKRQILLGRAAVMPIAVDIVKHGITTPLRREDSHEIPRVDDWLHRRLDRAVPGVTP